MDFTNKVVLITGASSGIGAATAVLYSKYSAKLALVGRNVENLKEVAQECEKSKGIKPLTIVADVRVVAELSRIVDDTVKEFGRLDVLVNNAGIFNYDSVRTINLEETFKPIFETNVRSIYLLTHHAVPHLIQNKGNIVNVSSILSEVIFENFDSVSYSMAKAALDQFTRIAAFELGSDGVRVNGIQPGVTESSIWERMGMNNESEQNFYKNAAKSNALKKIATGEEIANSILYLSSDLAKNITGTILVSDSGRSLGAKSLLTLGS